MSEQLSINLKEEGKIHYARLGYSPRLQRTLSLLKDGNPYTTMQIIQKACVCAVNSIICEPRENGFTITCKSVRRGVYEYRLVA